MRDEPPAELIDLLSRLGLADGDAIREERGRANALAQGLPLFPSVWIDALLQARRLTPFQAAQINAGRGPLLAIEPYVATHAPRSLGYADCQRARSLEGDGEIELLIARTAGDRADAQIEKLTELVVQLSEVACPAIAPAEQAGEADGRQWIAFARADGKPLDQWLSLNGRLPGEAVLEIARQTGAALAMLERAKLVHGDLSPAALRVARDGTALLTWAGVRGIWRPDERLAGTELPLEAFDYLAPERVTDGAAPSTATEIYAYGLLLWHLTTGRVPLAGGSRLAKLRAAQVAKIDNVRRWAPDTPPPLAETIRACTERDPKRRPASFAELTARIGVSTAGGKRILGHAVATNGRGWSALTHGIASRRNWKQSSAWAATATGCAAILVLVVVWPWWSGQESPRRADGPAQQTRTDSSDSVNHKLRDGAVAAAVANADVDSRQFVAPAVHIEPPETAESGPVKLVPRVNKLPPLILPAGKPIDCGGWRLQAGQTVRSETGSRAMVLVPPGGLLVAVEDIRFENVDFAWIQPPDTVADPERLAMIDLRAARAAFSGCSFQAVALDQVGSPAAIRWSGSAGHAASAGSGRLQLSDCVILGADAGIELRLTVPLALKVTNTLHLGSGPFVRLQHVPRIDEPMTIALDHSTVRGATSLLEFRSGRNADEPGAIAVTASACVFAPSRNGALLMVTGEGNPRPLIRAFEWSGQGALLESGARVAVQASGGKIDAIDTTELTIDGLVASQIEFAGAVEAGPAASRIVRWLAPLESVDPPGIDGTLAKLPSLPRASR